jgi:2-polyprenyl-3-methyl-5-hydroxy-6-metoxy-1,4-benzoquinol methylase
MTSLIHYTTCPACHSLDIFHVLDAKDYTVSQKTFQIWECGLCTLRFTQDVPGQEDIGAYYQSENYISHSNTKKGLVNRLYHQVRERSLHNKRKLLGNYVAAGKTPRLLDVGCGTGAFLAHMKQHGWAVEGIEPSTTAREQAVQQQLTVHAPEYLFNEAIGDFDIITMWHVLEHVHTLNEYMERLRVIMRPQATLFIAVPNYTSYDASAYGPKWAAYDVPRHLYHFSPDSMRTFLQAHGFSLKAIEPMWYDSFYVSMLSEKYKTGSGGLLKGGINGALSNLKALSNKERCSSLIYVIGQ